LEVIVDFNQRALITLLKRSKNMEDARVVSKQFTESFAATLLVVAGMTHHKIHTSSVN